MKQAWEVAVVAVPFLSRRGFFSLTEFECQKILGNLTEDGRAAVSTAVRLFNGYAAQLGVKPDYGRAVKGGSLLATASAPMSLEEMRRRLANY